jgi:ABC-type transporter Mla subunit MlaD
MNETLLIVFVAVTSIAVLIQAGILIGLYVAVRKSITRTESLANELQTNVLPSVEKFLPQVEAMLTTFNELKPKFEAVATNLSESSTTVKNQLARVDATLTDGLDRARLQIIRADELLSRTMDKVEDTTEFVQKTVVSPIRQVNGLMAAISTGVEVFLGQKKRHGKNGSSVPQDEMFI